MPSSPKQPCARPGCSNLVDRGRCAACSIQRESNKGTAHQRGYTYKWQKAAKAYLQAHPYAVDWFNEHGGRIYLAEVVDHIIPHRGDRALFWDSTNNWQGLTKRDHDRKTATEGGFGR